MGSFISVADTFDKKKKIVYKQHSLTYNTNADHLTG